MPHLRGECCPSAPPNSPSDSAPGTPFHVQNRSLGLRGEPCPPDRVTALAPGTSPHVQIRSPGRRMLDRSTLIPIRVTPERAPEGQRARGPAHTPKPHRLLGATPCSR